MKPLARFKSHLPPSTLTHYSGKLHSHSGCLAGEGNFRSAASAKFAVCISVLEVSLEFGEFNTAGVVIVQNFEKWTNVLALDRNLKFSNHGGDLVNSQRVASVDVKVIEHLLDEGFLTTAGHLDKSVSDFFAEEADSFLGLSIVFVLGALPRALHHSYKVLVRRHTGGDVSVVVGELGPGHFAVVVATSTIELVEEVLEDLFLGEAALQKVWVLGNVVNAGDVLDSNNA